MSVVFGGSIGAEEQGGGDGEVPVSPHHPGHTGAMVIYSDIFVSVVAALVFYDVVRWLLPRYLRAVRGLFDVFCGTFGIHWCRPRKHVEPCGGLGCFGCRSVEKRCR